MPMSIEKAYGTLKDNPPMTNKVLGNPASPFQGIAQLAQAYQNQANVKPAPVPMQSVLQQQAQQPTTFAKGDKVKSKSPDHKIEQNIRSQFGPNVPANIKKILKEGSAYALAHGRPDPGHLRKLLAAVAKLPPEIQAQYKPRIDAAKAALAKAKGVAGISKFAEGDEVEASDRFTPRAVLNEEQYFKETPGASKKDYADYVAYTKAFNEAMQGSQNSIDGANQFVKTLPEQFAKAREWEEQQAKDGNPHLTHQQYMGMMENQIQDDAVKGGYTLEGLAAIREGLNKESLQDSSGIAGLNIDENTRNLLHRNINNTLADIDERNGKYKGGKVSKFAEGDEVPKPKMREAVEELAGLYKSEGLSPEMAQMMQIAQEGKMRQGLGSTIAAALAGAATPHALQAGQNSAMMAGEAANRGLGALNAGQDAMMARAAEIEGAPTKNWNTALGAVFNAEQEKATYGAELAKAQTAANASGANTLAKIMSNENIAKDAEEGRNARAENALISKEKIDKAGRGLKRWAELNHNIRSSAFTHQMALKQAVDRVGLELEKYKSDPLGKLDSSVDVEGLLKKYYLESMNNPNMLGGVAGISGIGGMGGGEAETLGEDATEDTEE